MRSLQHTIKAVIRPGEESGYVAECTEISVVTQGQTLDEVTQNLREAVALHLEGEDLSEFGLKDNPMLLVTMELDTTTHIEHGEFSRPFGTGSDAS